MVPTILVGVGGTGVEVLSRVRRLVEESYGSLKKFPIIHFLAIDTDKDYKVSNPEAAGSPLQDHEKYWASVSRREVNDIMSNMPKFPWIESWFPRELERNIGTLEAGSGQIRACGRFASFYNYHQIKARFNEACDRVLANGYAALMELSYFSDYRTE